jgi:hypothetical protein
MKSEQTKRIMEYLVAVYCSDVNDVVVTVKDGDSFQLCRSVRSSVFARELQFLSIPTSFSESVETLQCQEFLLYIQVLLATFFYEVRL